MGRPPLPGPTVGRSAPGDAHGGPNSDPVEAGEIGTPGGLTEADDASTIAALLHCPSRYRIPREPYMDPDFAEPLMSRRCSRPLNLDL